jgi:hypothetical protein
MDKKEKLSFILKKELEITEAVLNGHKASNDDKFSIDRKLIEHYRIELGIIKNKENIFNKIKKLYKSEFKEWEDCKMELMLLEEEKDSNKITEKEYDSKKMSLELTMILIETSIGIE